MSERLDAVPARQRAERQGGTMLAVYYAGRDVNAHVAALRRSGRFQVTCLPQRRTARLRTKGFNGILWELAPGRPPDRRRLTSIARGIPVLSYSAHGGREVADLSRSIGFTSHLKAPLRLADVERALGLATSVDLSARLRALQGSLRRELSRHAVLAEMVREVNAPLDPGRVADVLVAQAATRLPAAGWGVLAMDPGQWPQLLGQRALSPELETAVAAIGAWVIRQGQPYLAPSVADDKRVTATGGAAVGLPLVCRGRTTGALVGLERVASSQVPRLAPATLAVLSAWLEPAAIALDSALRLQRAEALSVTDDLTQLYNSRYLSQVLRRETKRASRSGRALSLLFIDLDGFKSVNDQYGHLCGSRALVEAAAVIRTSARETDTAARFGGDEFAVVLPDTGSEGAVAVGERVRDRIAARELLSSEGLGVRLTASVGVATLPDVAVSADGLLRAADRAMYRVKEHGKNGIYVAT